MPAPLPDELRDRVVQAWAGGRLSRRELARRFGVGTATVARWVKQRHPSKRYRDRQQIGPAQMSALATLMQLADDATHEQLRVAFASLTGLHVSRSTITRAIARLRAGAIPAA